MIFFVYRAVRNNYNKAQRRHNRRLEIENRCRNTDKSETIFVSIVSYRDPELAQTLFDCLEKASCPFRVTIGVCQHSDKGDEDAMVVYKRLAREPNSTGNYESRIKILRLPASQARGPAHARAIVQHQLYAGETYYMQVDSHTVFSPDWDIHCLKQLRQCPEVKSVLTMFPDNFNSRADIDLSNKWYLKPARYLYYLRRSRESHKLAIQAARPLTKVPNKPVVSVGWAGCFSFSSAQLIRDVPYAPDQPWILDGEDETMAIRMWTSGWTMYSPRTMLIRQKWSREVRPLFWEKMKSSDWSEHDASYDRLIKRLSRPTTYGLGSVRSLREWLAFVGHETPRYTTGVSQNASPDEIRLKWETAAAYRHVLSQNQQQP